MTRTISIEVPNGMIFLSPVPRARFRSYFLPLLHAIHEQWLKLTPEEMLADTFSLGLIQSAIDLIPTYPDKALTLPLLQKDPMLFRRLFIGLGVDGVSDLITLHTFTPIESAKPIPEVGDKHITIDDIPLTSSGDSDIDLLADLMSGLESPEAAFMLMERLDSESLDKLFYRMKQRSDRLKDPDAIVQGYLKERFDDWAKENQSLVEQALYGDLLE